MAKKSSKTAHVLNLLSPTKVDTAPEAEEEISEIREPRKKTEEVITASKTEAAAPEPAEKKPKSEPMESILHLSESTENLSELIKGNLEKELFSELSAKLVESAASLPSDAFHPDIKTRTPADIAEVINAPADLENYAAKPPEEAVKIEIEHSISKKNPISALDRPQANEPEEIPEFDSDDSDESLEAQLSALVGALAEDSKAEPLAPAVEHGDMAPADVSDAVPYTETVPSTNVVPMTNGDIEAPAVDSVPLSDASAVQDIDNPPADDASAVPAVDNVPADDASAVPAVDNAPAADVPGSPDVLTSAADAVPANDNIPANAPEVTTGVGPADDVTDAPAVDNAVPASDALPETAQPVSELSAPAAKEYVDENGNSLFFTNIYETIVRSLAADYLKKFQVCDCGRCVADTIALTLTKLPSKYVVTDSPDIESAINYVEQKEITTIMTELTKACFEIDAHPRHK